MFSGMKIQCTNIFSFILSYFFSLPFSLKRHFSKGVFLYKWTVNWRFIPEDIFLSRTFHVSLLVTHLILVFIFFKSRWLQLKLIESKQKIGLNTSEFWYLILESFRNLFFSCPKISLWNLSLSLSFLWFFSLISHRFFFSFLWFLSHRRYKTKNSVDVVYSESDWYNMFKIVTLSILFLVLFLHSSSTLDHFLSGPFEVSVQLKPSEFPLWLIYSSLPLSFFFLLPFSLSHQLTFSH